MVAWKGRNGVGVEWAALVGRRWRALKGAVCVFSFAGAGTWACSLCSKAKIPGPCYASGFRSRRRRCCCGGKIGSPPRDVCLGMRDAIALSMLTRASRFAHVNVNEVQRQQNTWLPAVASKPVQAKVQVWRFLLC